VITYEGQESKLKQTQPKRYKFLQQYRNTYDLDIAVSWKMKRLLFVNIFSKIYAKIITKFFYQKKVFLRIID
jgi:protein gp37